jgi:hypothetical protein
MHHDDNIRNTSAMWWKLGLFRNYSSCLVKCAAYKHDHLLHKQTGLCWRRTLLRWLHNLTQFLRLRTHHTWATQALPSPNEDLTHRCKLKTETLKLRNSQTLKTEKPVIHEIRWLTESWSLTCIPCLRSPKTRSHGCGTENSQQRVTVLYCGNDPGFKSKSLYKWRTFSRYA